MPKTDTYAENAKQDALRRKENKAYEDYKKQEKEENEAPRKAVGEAIDYLKGKASKFGEDVTKFAKEYGDTYKKGLGLKKGGSVKTKRYAVGGEADDTAKSGVFKDFKSGESEYERKDNEVAEKPSSFKEAFAEARRSGDKTFQYEGKKYTTEMAAPKKAAPRAEPKETAKETTSEHLAEEFKKRPAGTGMKESARQSRVDRVRRNVGSNLETFGMKKGGSVSSASKRADGCAQRGKTRGKMV